MHTIKLQVDDSIYSHIIFLLSNLSKRKIIILEDKTETLASKHDESEIKVYSHHSANLIEEWKDDSEDNVWK